VPSQTFESDSAALSIRWGRIESQLGGNGNAIGLAHH